MIIANEWVEEGVAELCSHAFYKLIDKWWDGCIVDCYHIEALEVMDNAKCSILLHAEPLGPVGGIRWFIYAGGHLSFEEVNDFIHDSCGSQDILVDLWGVGDCENLDRGEVFFMNVSALGFSPGQCMFIGFEDMVGEVFFFGP